MSRSEFEATDTRPRLCPICEQRGPSRNHTVYGWVCYLCLQRWQSGRDAVALAAEDTRRAALPVAPPITIQSPAPVLRARPTETASTPAPAPPVDADTGASIPLSNNITPETEWVPAAKSLPTASPPDASPVEPPPPAKTAPSPTTARPAEPVSRKAVPATRTAAVGGEADALIQDKVQDAMMDEPNLSSVVLAARLGISAGGVRSCVCRLRKRGVLPPPARQYAPSSRPRAGAQKEAIRAAVLADPDISSAALAARLGTSPDTVRSCISLLRRSGALPPAPRRLAEPAPPAEPQPREPQLQERIQAAVLAEPRVTSTTLAARFNTSPASVRSAVGTLRQRGLLPPAPERPLVEPDTMRGRLLQLITEQPGISAVGAAPALGVGIMAIHDASHALRKKGLILPNDPALPGLYPLSSKGAAMPAEKKPADTDARLQEALAAEEAAGTLIADLADALGIETDEGVDGADVLVVVRAQTEIVKRLIEEKQGAMVKADRLEREVKDLKSRVTGLMDELASERRSYSDLERDLRLAEVRLATATPNLIAADLERRIELWGSAYRLEQEAEKLQQQQSETLACGIVLSADELDSVAALRLDRAMVLRSQALTGAA